MEQIMLVLSTGLSGFIVVHILMQYMNDRFERISSKNYIYILSKIIAVIFLSVLSIIFESMYIILAWMLVTALFAGILYKHKELNVIKRVLLCEALFLVLSIFEGVCAIVVDIFLELTDLNILNKIYFRCVEITFSKIFVIVVYYLVIQRLFVKKNEISRFLYGIYLAIFVYGFFYMLVITNEYKTRGGNIYLFMNLVSIVCMMLVVLYFLRVRLDKNTLENDVKLLENQALMQWRYYIAQEKKHNKTLQILHDVNNHIKTIEQLYATGESKLAYEYTQEINDLLKPLVPFKFTGNPILDIILTDKKALAKEKGIEFQVRVNHIDLAFIDAMDLTTIFGNLIDNAIEACEEVKDDKKIFLSMGQVHEMICVKINNSCGNVEWNGDMPISRKGRNGGIGLKNVKRCIEKYDGSIKMKQENKEFIVELFINL